MGGPGVLGIAGSRGCEDLEMSPRLLQEPSGVRAGDGFSWVLLPLPPPSQMSGAAGALGPVCPRSLGRVGSSGTSVSPVGVTSSPPSWPPTSYQCHHHLCIGPCPRLVKSGLTSWTCCLVLGCWRSSAPFAPCTSGLGWELGVVWGMSFWLIWGMSSWHVSLLAGHPVPR